jgi:AAA domain
VTAAITSATLAAFGIKENGAEGRFVGPCPFCRTPGFVWNRELDVFTCANCNEKAPAGETSGSTGELLERLRREVGIRVADVATETVRWLWDRRIPFAEITLLDGDPGLGKTFLTHEITAAVTTGCGLPDGSPIKAGNVLLLSAEDGIGDTIRPRLEAAGADLERVHVLGHKHRGLLFPRDLAGIEGAILLHSARLLVIDPLMAHLDASVNSHRDQDVRTFVMAPLALMAEKTGAAVLLVRHLNKGSTGNPLYRGGGSIGFVGAARSTLLVASDPDDETRRVLAPFKSNLCLPPRSLGFRITEMSNGVPRIEWLGESGYRAGTLLRHADAPASEEDRSAVGEASEWLLRTLASGAVESKEVTGLAGIAGISNRTLWRAKEKLNVKTRKRGAGAWMWDLSEECRADLHPSNVGSLGEVGSLHPTRP